MLLRITGLHGKTVCTGRETIFLALPQPMEKGEPKFHTLNPREMHIRSLGHTFKVVQQYENPHICRMLKETLPGNQAHLTNHSQGQALNFHLEIFSSNSPGRGVLNFQGKNSYSISAHYLTQGHFLQLSFILLPPLPHQRKVKILCVRETKSWRQGIGHPHFLEEQTTWK